MNLDDGTTSYDFTLLPGSMTMIRADKPNATVQTYSSVAYFAWSPSIVGKSISFKWNAMPADMWAQLDTFFQADTALIFDPTLTETPAATTYNVEMTQLDGEYWLGGYGEISDDYRKDVTMTLLILSEVA
jgi:hypothetical protein